MRGGGRTRVDWLKFHHENVTEFKSDTVLDTNSTSMYAPKPLLNENGEYQNMQSNNTRRCICCCNVMVAVKCSPAYVGANDEVYTCSVCNKTERVTTVTKAWLYACSLELRPPA